MLSYVIAPRQLSTITCICVVLTDSRNNNHRPNVRTTKDEGANREEKLGGGGIISSPSAQSPRGPLSGCKVHYSIRCWGRVHPGPRLVRKQIRHLMGTTELRFQQSCVDATYQKRLPNLKIAPFSPLLVNEAHHVPHGYLRRPVRRLAVGAGVPGDNNPEVLYVSRWI